jgi:hypothetical protein
VSEAKRDLTQKNSLILNQIPQRTAFSIFVRSPEPKMHRQANETAAGEIVIGRWSCGNRKQIEIGDRVFLIRLGVEPKGIVGSGWVIKPLYFDGHWDAKKHAEGKKGLFINCEWERILNPTIDVRIPR